MKNLIIVFTGIIALFLNFSVSKINAQSTNFLEAEVEVLEVIEEGLRIIINTCIFGDVNENYLFIIVKKNNNPKPLISELFYLNKLEGYFYNNEEENRFFYTTEGNQKCHCVFSVPNQGCFHLGASLTDSQASFEIRYSIENLSLTQEEIRNYQDSYFTSERCTMVKIN